MQSIDVREILELLGPNRGLPLFFNILIYVVFFFTLIGLFLQSDKAVLPTMVLSGGLLLCILAKLIIFDEREFGTFVINAGMFLAPTLVVGMTRAEKSRGPLILAALVGAVYFFAFWFFYHFQR
ncbi:MAG: hypothetical protein K8L99_34735 [Anaerolineae bacterium]|nr:hypothetical protein [Anaerolineae bacterium]